MLSIVTKIVGLVFCPLSAGFDRLVVFAAVVGPSMESEKRCRPAKYGRKRLERFENSLPEDMSKVW